MQIDISKFMGIVTGIVAVLLIAVFGYFSYSLFFIGGSPSDTVSVSSINISLLGPKMQKSASALVNATDKISLKKSDLGFTESDLFKSFTEIQDGIPLSESRGRPNPFVPYAAP